VFHQIESLNSSILLYEDSYNQRIRIDEYTGDLTEVIQLIQQNLPGWTGKIIVKVLSPDVPFFISAGYSCEACVEGYFSGKSMYFLVKYPDYSRNEDIHYKLEQSILADILVSFQTITKNKNQSIRVATVDDSDRIAVFFGKIFKVYPTPVSNPSYIKKMLIQGTVFVFIEEENQIISTASAEINTKYSNAELTDCATLETERGKGFNRQLLQFLEEQLIQKGILCHYTIARSRSIGVNKVFYNLGYMYGGRLKNNCYIYSGMENMNVWYKVNEKNELVSKKN